MFGDAFAQLMGELAKQAGRHAHIAKTMTMMAMVNLFTFNADMTSHVAPVKTPEMDKSQNFRNVCVAFKNNRNDIYGSGAQMEVLDVALRESTSPAAQIFIGETSAIIGKKKHREFVANNDNMTRDGFVHAMMAGNDFASPHYDDALSARVLNKDGNVLYPRFGSNVAA